MASDSVLMVTKDLSGKFINLARLRRCRKLAREDTILRKDEVGYRKRLEVQRNS